jgi:hypothetical protein
MRECSGFDNTGKSLKLLGLRATITGSAEALDDRPRDVFSGVRRRVFSVRAGKRVQIATRALTVYRSLKYRPDTSSSSMRHSFSFFVRPASASYWWWYGTATEEATARV